MDNGRGESTTLCWMVRKPSLIRWLRTESTEVKYWAVWLFRDFLARGNGKCKG